MSRPLSMKQEAKIRRICSVINYPLEKKFIGTSSILARSKSRVLPTDPLFTHCIMTGKNWNSSDFPSRRSARPPICLFFEYNLQCHLLVTQLFPPHPRVFQWLRLFPYLNLFFVQASGISNSASKKRKRTWCVLGLFGFDLSPSNTRVPITHLLWL